jgi:hypothetical protein
MTESYFNGTRLTAPVYPVPWHIHFAPSCRIGGGRVFDATTGQDVSMLFPVSATRRLRRSAELVRPVRLSVFRYGTIDGKRQVLLDGNRAMKDPVLVWVELVGAEGVEAVA